LGEQEGKTASKFMTVFFPTPVKAGFLVLFLAWKEAAPTADGQKRIQVNLE